MSDAPGSFRERIHRGLSVLLAVTALTSVALLVAILGWEHEAGRFHYFEQAARTTLLVFAFGQTGRFLTAPEPLRWLRHHVAGVLLAVAALAESIGYGHLFRYLLGVFPDLAEGTTVLLLLAVSQVPVLLDLGLRFIRLQDFFAERRISPGVVLMLTFGALILAGTGLLLLPRATTAGLSWLDALFTSTSAVCVTGLVVTDTETAFSPTGHFILLVLLQVGGLGVMTLTTFLAQMFGGVSLRGRVLVQDLISEENLGRIGRTLPLLLIMTVLFEAAGFLALYGAFDAVDETRGGRAFSALFHSVSAFCNAGFSNWSGGLYDPIVRANAWAQAVLMVLIVAGGMGFPVVYATTVWGWRRFVRLFAQRARRHPLSVHARLAWLATAVLVVGGAIAIGLSEFVLADHPHDTPAALASLFQSVTARTAGFNISPTEAMTPAAVATLVFLMFIGGCPASTAGGVRTTALVVAVLNVRRILLGRRDVEAFGRRIPEEVVTRAMVAMFLAVGWIAGAGTLLAMLEPHVALADLVFEVVSALSTVGLSRGVTAGLSDWSKVVLIVTMFAGRIGILYFVFAFVGRREPLARRLPEENVLVT